MPPPNERRDPDLSAVEIAKLEGQMKEGFAALGGKLDTLIAKQEAAETARALDRTTADARHEDHETRMRAIESHATADHSERIDALEGAVAEVKARPVITWRALWGAVVSGITVAGILVGIVLGVLKAVSGN